GEYFVHSPRALISFDAHIANQFTTMPGIHSRGERGIEARVERKRGWSPIPAFSHREPPFCVAAFCYRFLAPFLAPPFFAPPFAAFFAPPFFAVAILCVLLS